MSIQDFIETYGYLAVLVGTFLEGETILVLGGFAANHHLDLMWVIVAAFVAAASSQNAYPGKRARIRYTDYWSAIKTC